MPTLFLTTCGTSLLTNNTDNKDNRAIVNKYSNEKDEADIPKDDFDCLSKTLETAQRCLEDDLREQPKANRKTGAERTSLEASLKQYRSGNGDIHFLLHTDTYLGAQCAEMLRVYFEKRFNLTGIQIHQMEKLNTKDEKSFRNGVRELAKWLTDTIPGYRGQNYQIIFNLSAGFKSLQGVLQMMGNFFADEIVYIFETSNDLIRIPRIPASLDKTLEDSFQKHLNTVRLLGIYDVMNTTDIFVDDRKFIRDSAIFFEEDGDMTSISPWGYLCWDNVKKDIYETKLLESPIPNIVYSEQFKKDAANLSQQQYYDLNIRVDDFCVYLNDHNKNIRRLNFKPIGEKKGFDSTHEFDAWADSPGYRVFLHKENDKWVFDGLHAGIGH